MLPCCGRGGTRGWEGGGAVDGGRVGGGANSGKEKQHRFINTRASGLLLHLHLLDLHLT